MNSKPIKLKDQHSESAQLTRYSQDHPQPTLKVRPVFLKQPLSAKYRKLDTDR
jgi:hypothetical protein